MADQSVGRALLRQSRKNGPRRGGLSSLRAPSGLPLVSLWPPSGVVLRQKEQARSAEDGGKRNTSPYCAHTPGESINNPHQVRASIPSTVLLSLSQVCYHAETRVPSSVFRRG
jgi:hypothetical protein